MEHGKQPTMQVIARDAHEHIGTGRIDRHVGIDGIGHRARALCVDEDRRQLVASCERTLNNEIAFGDENTRHVTIGLLPTLTQHVVAQTLEDFDALVIRIVHRDPTVDHENPWVVERTPTRPVRVFRTSRS